LKTNANKVAPTISNDW